MRTEPPEYSWLEVKVREINTREAKYEAEGILVTAKEPGMSKDRIAVGYGDTAAEALREVADEVEGEN